MSMSSRGEQAQSAVNAVSGQTSIPAVKTGASHHYKTRKRTHTIRFEYPLTVFPAKMMVRSADRVRRSLFGAVDKDRSRSILRDQMRILDEEYCQKWNFDFNADKPLPGRYEWTVADTDGVAVDTGRDDAARLADPLVVMDTRGIAVDNHGYTVADVSDVAVQCGMSLTATLSSTPDVNTMSDFDMMPMSDVATPGVTMSAARASDVTTSDVNTKSKSDVTMPCVRISAVTTSAVTTSDANTTSTLDVTAPHVKMSDVITPDVTTSHCSSQAQRKRKQSIMPGELSKEI